MPIILKNISKSFEDKTVVQDLNFTFPERGIVVITGRSGVGKTTLLKMILGLVSPDEGEITGNNQKFSVVFQENRLVPTLNTLENILYVTGKQKKEMAIKMLECVGLAGEEDTIPENLSGGMARRVALARALCVEGTLILDEPFKEIDVQTKQNIIPLIEQRSKNDLVVMVTHNQEEIDLLNAIEFNMKGE